MGAWSRPGLSIYRGRDGIRRMLGDVISANGAYDILLDDVHESAPDVVTLRTRLVRRDDPTYEIELETRIEMRDGLIYRAGTLPA